MTKPRKKPGPKPRNYKRVDVHFYVDPDDYEWFKDQPEGFAGLIRRLMKDYRQRQTAPERPPTSIRPEVLAPLPGDREHPARRQPTPA